MSALFIETNPGKSRHQQQCTKKVEVVATLTRPIATISSTKLLL